MSSVTHLKFINRSMSPAPSDVVFFDAPEFYDDVTLLLPWLYICQCPYGYYHPFDYPHQMSIGLRDDWGNFSPALPVEHGKRYYIQRSGKREVLIEGEDAQTDNVEIFNNLPEGAPSIYISRGDVNVACRSNLAPGEFFSFGLADALLARKISGILTPERLRNLAGDGFCSRLDLKDVKKADVLMTGGGTGARAKRYSFSLANINP